jgi:hypothetical protein
MADRYTRDLKVDVLFRAGEHIDGSSHYDRRTLEYLNRAYQSLCTGGAELMPEIQEDWWWLIKSPPGVLFLIPSFFSNQGPSVILGTPPATVSASIGGATITFSGIVNFSLVGWMIKIGPHPDIFRIIAHNAGTAVATLDNVWSGPSMTAAYIAGLTEYTVAADVMQLMAPMRCFQKNGNTDPYKVHEADIEKMETEYPLAEITTGMPEMFARVGVTKVRFNRLAGITPDVYFRVEYDYLQLPAPLTSPGLTEEPLVPKEWRHILADWALFWLLIDKGDARAESIGHAAKSGLQAMALRNRDRLRNRSPLPYAPASDVQPQPEVLPRT